MKKKKPNCEWSGWIFIYEIHWKQLRVALHKLSLSVRGNGAAQWVIPLFMQLQGVSGPLGINMSHTATQTDDSVLLWRRMGWRWKRQPYLSNSVITYSFILHSAVSFTSAKVTLWICLAQHIPFLWLFVEGEWTSHLSWAFRVFGDMWFKGVCSTPPSGTRG